MKKLIIFSFILLLVPLVLSSPYDAISKEEIPYVSLYIWSYCPYGVPALSSFAEVASEFEDFANFDVYLFHYTGEMDAQQNKIQACIQYKGYEKEYWDYAHTFLNEVFPERSGGVEADLENSVNLMNSVGINSTEILDCVNTDGERLQNEHTNSAENLEVAGSPTLVINDVKVSTPDKSVESLKEAICFGFSSPPESCGEIVESVPTDSSDDYDSSNEGRESSSSSGTGKGSGCTNGCSYNSSCIPFGYRLSNENNESVYCDLSKELISQKVENSSCQNDFECLSGQCSDGKCINLQKTLEETNGSLQKIINFLKQLFGFE
jgi:hypothetical protein